MGREKKSEYMQLFRISGKNSEMFSNVSEWTMGLKLYFGNENTLHLQKAQT
jgi:hypothetical protein